MTLRRFFSLGLALLLIVILGWLLARTRLAERWSDWYMGDAQTLLAVEHWAHEGFFSTSFLWIPQGYSVVVREFDEPGLNHHAHGVRLTTPNGEAVGKRAYTHYPSWYAVPYGLLRKLGVTDKSLYQCLALFFSFLGLWGIYRFFGREIGTVFALLFVVRYCLTPGFLCYADSLSNLAYEDGLRFGFLLLWARYLQVPTSWKGFGVAFLWYFLATMVSWDSIAFMGMWAFFTSLATPRSLWRLGILVWAPLLALGLQLAQNTWYMGWESAWSDWVSQFFHYSTQEAVEYSGAGFFESRWVAIADLLQRGFGMSDWKVGAVLLLFLGLVSGLPQEKRTLWLRLAAGLFLAGCGYALVFPSKVPMAYQHRQLLPFVVLVSSGVLYLGWQRLSDLWQAQRRQAFVAATVVGLVAVAGLKLVYTDPLRGSLDFTGRSRLDSAGQAFFKRLSEAYPSGDKIILQVGSLFSRINVWNGHHQVHPLYEYQAGAPILHFPTIDSLWRDYDRIQKASPETRIVVVWDPRNAAPGRRLEKHSAPNERFAYGTVSETPAKSE